MNTPTIMSAHQLTPPPTIDQASTTTTIKLEDLQVAMGNHNDLASLSSAMSDDGSSPPPSSEGSKAVKKRKSWGQVLPEPKTNLPPRKRAKTEDEKEQRRIERVKRNRLAAHNSRERKRQEYELLQAEKDRLDAELGAAREAMARMNAELKVYRQKYPGEVPQQSFDTISTSDDYESILGTSDTVCPAQTSTSFPSPISMDSMDSPRDDSCQPETPAYSETTSDFDQTRYPAVSVDLSASLATPTISTGDMGFPFTLQPHASLDEKPAIDSLFDFDQFPENTSVESTGLADSHDFFGSALFGHPSSTNNPYGLSDGLDAKHFDLQIASGATLVSDEALAAEH